MEGIISCCAVQDFSMEVFDTSRGTAVEKVGRKSVTWSRVRRRLQLIWRLRQRLSTDPPDIVHFHFGSEGLVDQLGYFLMMWVSISRRSRLLAHLHVDPEGADLPGGSRLGKLVFRSLSHPISAFVVLRAQYAVTLRSAHVKCPVWVLPNMVDDGLTTLNLDLKSHREGLDVAFLGRLTAEKGLAELLEAAKRLASEAVRFYIAGAATERDLAAMTAWLAERGLDRYVRLLGPVSGAAKRQLLAQVDVLVAPSHAESFGVTVLEGMAAGLPVIATRLSSFEELVAHEVTGLLYPIGDVDALVESFRRLVADERLRNDMGRAGRERFHELFSAEKVGAALRSCYQELLRMHGEEAR